MKKYCKLILSFLAVFTILILLHSCSKDSNSIDELGTPTVPKDHEGFYFSDLEGISFGAEHHMSFTVESEYTFVDYEGEATNKTTKSKIPLSRGQNISFINISDSEATLRFSGGQAAVLDPTGNVLSFAIVSPIVGKRTADIPINYERLNDNDEYAFNGTANLGEYSIKISGTAKPDSNPEITVTYDMQFPDNSFLGKSASYYWTYYKSERQEADGSNKPNSPFNISANIKDWSKYDVPFSAEDFLQSILNAQALKQSEFGLGNNNPGMASIATLFNIPFFYLIANRNDGCINSNYICHVESNRMTMNWEEMQTFPYYTIQNLPAMDGTSFTIYINPAAIVDARMVQWKVDMFYKDTEYPESGVYYTYYPLNTTNFRKLQFGLLSALGIRMATGIPMTYDLTDGNAYVNININDADISRNILKCLITTYTENPDNMERLKGILGESAEYAAYQTKIPTILSDMSRLIDSQNNKFSFGFRFMKQTYDGTGAMGWSSLYGDAWKN